MKLFKNACTLISLGIALTAAPLMAKTVTRTVGPINGSVLLSSTNAAVGSATAVVTFNNISGANVTNGDTLTLQAPNGGAKYIYLFTNTISTNGSPYSVLIGADAATSSVNLLQAINNGPAGLHAGTNFGSNTPISLLVSAVQTATNVVTLTALNAYPGTLGNKIGIYAQSLSNVIQFSPQQATLVGGYESAFNIDPNWLGVGISIFQNNTNSGPVTNATTYTFAVSGVKTNLYTGGSTNISPTLVCSVAQGSNGSSFFTNWPSSSTSTITLTTNVYQGLTNVGAVGGTNTFLTYSLTTSTNTTAGSISGAQWIGMTQTANTSSTNNTPFQVYFTFTEDDGK